MSQLLTTREVVGICELLKGFGITHEQIAESFDCDVRTVMRIEEDVFTKKTYNDNWNNLRLFKMSRV